MAEEPKKTAQDTKPEGLSIPGKIETKLEELGVDKLSFRYVSPEAKERARKADPEAETLEDKAKYDAMHGHLLKGELEHLEAIGKSVAHLREKIIDSTATGLEEMNEMVAKEAGKLGGPEARRLAEEAASDMYSLHLKDATNEGLKADSIIAANKIVGKLGGPEAVAHLNAGIEATNHGRDKEMNANAEALLTDMARKLGGKEAAEHAAAAFKLMPLNSSDAHVEAHKEDVQAANVLAATVISDIARKHGAPDAAAHLDAGIKAMSNALKDKAQNNKIDELGEEVKGGLHIAVAELEVAKHAGQSLYRKAKNEAAIDAGAVGIMMDNAFNKDTVAGAVGGLTGIAIVDLADKLESGSQHPANTPANPTVKKGPKQL